jgi:hypothetical protein
VVSCPLQKTWACTVSRCLGRRNSGFVAVGVRGRGDPGARDVNRVEDACLGRGERITGGLTARGVEDPRRATVTRAAGAETLADRPPMPRRVGRDRGILRKMMKSEEIYTTFLPVVQIV